MSDSKRRWLNYFLLLLIFMTIAFIWGNSLMDSERSSAVSNGLLEWLKLIAGPLNVFLENDLLLRKCAHFAEYFLLGFELALLRAINGKQSRGWLLSLALGCLTVAGIDESIQLFVGRNGNLADVMLDLFGGICGIAFVYSLSMLNKIIQKSSDA